MSKNQEKKDIPVVCNDGVFIAQNEKIIELLESIKSLLKDISKNTFPGQ